MNNAATNQNASGDEQPIVTVPTGTFKLPGGKEIKVGVSLKSEEKLKLATPQQSVKVVTKAMNSGGVSSDATTAAGLKQKQDAQKSISSTSAQSTVKKLLTPAQQKSATNATTVSSSATPPVKVTTPTLKSVTPLSLVTNHTAETSDESLQLGEAFTLSPSHQAKILSHTSEMHKAGAKTTAKKGAASAKASVTSKKRVHHPPRTLKLSELEIELKSVATKWRKLGRGLNQQDATIEQISAQNGNSPERCLSAVLKTWHTVAATGGKVAGVSLWMSLLKTLRKDVIGEKTLADSLQDKYGINVKIVPGMALWLNVVCSRFCKKRVASTHQGFF